MVEVVEHESERMQIQFGCGMPIGKQQAEELVGVWLPQVQQLVEESAEVLPEALAGVLETLLQGVKQAWTAHRLDHLDEATCPC